MFIECFWIDVWTLPAMSFAQGTTIWSGIRNTNTYFKLEKGKKLNQILYVSSIATVPLCKSTAVQRYSKRASRSHEQVTEGEHLKFL